MTSTINVDIIDVKSVKDLIDEKIKYNTAHLYDAISLGGNRAFRRSAIENKFSGKSNSSLDINWLHEFDHVILYDNNSSELEAFKNDNFRYSVLESFSHFKSVKVIQGGFLEFSTRYPVNCWYHNKRLSADHLVASESSDDGLECLLNEFVAKIEGAAYSPHSSTSSASSFIESEFSGFSKTDDKETQACEVKTPTSHRSVTAFGSYCFSDSPTCSPSSRYRKSSNVSADPLLQPPSVILPHVLLGCQRDAMCSSTMSSENVTHVINVSKDGEESPFVKNDHFLRLPIDDTSSAEMQPHFDIAFKFLDEAEKVKGRVLIHCYAGISRSPSLAVAYLMFKKHIPMQTAYDLVKESRLGVSPNLNFICQLQDYESRMGLTETVTQSKTSLSSGDYAVPVIQEPSTSTGRGPMFTPSGSKRRVCRPSTLEVPFPVPSTMTGKPSPAGSDIGTPTDLTDRSPSEGKRKRLSVALPSPCTGLSLMGLSSPSDASSQVKLSPAKRPTSLIGEALSKPKDPIQENISHQKAACDVSSTTPELDSPLVIALPSPLHTTPDSFSHQCRLKLLHSRSDWPPCIDLDLDHEVNSFAGIQASCGLTSVRAASDCHLAVQLRPRKVTECARRNAFSTHGAF